MATKETVWDLVQSMATLWRFPGKDLKATAKTYHRALRDLSDDQATEAVTALLSEWGKPQAPAPADILTTAKAFKRQSNPLPRLPRSEPSHDEIIAKIKRDMAPLNAVLDVLGDYKPFDKWTEDEKRRVARAQAAARLDNAGKVIEP